MYSKLTKMTMDNVIESSTSNASVVHDIQSIQSEVKPMTININRNNIKKFDWKVYKYTIKQLNINAEYKALRHFNKYARPGTKTYIKYLRNLYGIMPYFDEKIYMKYANINENISIEQLYIYFRTSGYKEYPLNEEYDRLYYDIEDIFDTDIYYKRYSDIINNYLYTDDNYDAGSDDWETGSQMSSLTSFSQISTNTTQTRGSMLSSFINNANNHRHGRVLSQNERIEQTNNDEYNKWKENLYTWYEVKETLNKKIYKFYKEKKDEYSMDNKYFLMKYNINNPLFDPKLYIKINNLNYNLNYNEDLDRVYALFSKNQKLDDNYYKIYYNIPNDLNIEVFIERYIHLFEDKYDFLKVIDQEQKNYVYMVFNTMKDTENSCYFDDRYFRLWYNISDEFNFNSYIQRYPEIIYQINNKNLKCVDRYVKISKEEKYIYENFKIYITQYDLDDNYYRILYNIPEEFDYNIFIKVYPDVITINNLQDESTILKLSDYVKDSVLFDNRKIIYKYYNKNSKNYSFNDTYYSNFYINENNIPKNINEKVYINMYNNLKIKIDCIQYDKEDNKKEYYNLYYKYIAEELKENSLDDDYYRNVYNILSDFDINIYVKRYNNKLNEKLINIPINTLEYNEKVYQLIDLDNMPLDDKYYRLLYNIPDLLDAISYVKRYPDIKDELIGLTKDTLEYNIKVYNLCKTLLNYFALDDSYYKIKYDISFLFSLDKVVLYKEKYNLENSNYENEYQWYYEEGNKKIDLLSDKYLNILFNVSEDFNWKIYYFNNKDIINSKDVDDIIKNNIDDTNINKLKSYCYFVTKETNIIDFIKNNTVDISSNKDILKTIDIERNKYYNVSSEFNYLSYNDNNAFFYMNTRINVNPDFIYLFYKNKITLNDLYNFYKNNVIHEHIKEIDSFTSKELIIEEQFIKNYEYLLSTNISSLEYKEYFVLNDFLEDFYRNKKYNYHIKLFDKSENDVINKILHDKDVEYNLLFNNYKKINYNNLFNKFKSKELTFSNKITNLNIAYIYFAYDTSLFTVSNLLNSIRYIPNNSNIYIFTNNSDIFNDICNFMSNIIAIEVDKIGNMSIDLINKYIKEEYIFIWNPNYIMINDHIFIENEIIDDIMISNTNDKYIGIGILRKKITNAFKNINTANELRTFRKHNKMHNIISMY